MHTGGWSDKLGNRYEGRWVARQLLSLIAGKVQAVRLESFSEDHVDVSVARLDGIVEFHQCKRTIDSTGWTIQQLRKRNVLGPLRTHLSESPRNRYSFVSTQQTELVRLTDLSNQADDTATFKRAIDESNKDKSLWKEWCEAVEYANEPNAAFDLLRRADFVVHGDGRSELQHLCDFATFVLFGEAREIIARLTDYATDHMGQWVHADTLRRFIEQETSFELRELAYSEEIPQTIEQRCAEYRQSIAPYLVGGSLIPRPEAQTVLQSIQSATKRFHVLHGAFGQGKSCVLYQLLSLLDGEGIPYFCVRFDVHTPQANTREFGKRLGLPESPVRCLQALAGNRPSVLVLDQLDALHWSPHHEPSSWTVFLQLMSEVFQADVIVHAVVACRTFDLQNDPNIKAWKNDKERGEGIEEIRVTDLQEDSAKKVVEKHGQSWTILSKAQRDLLRKPLHLYMWSQLLAGTTTPPAFRTSTDILRSFWNEIRKRLLIKGCTSADIQAAVQKLVGRMDRDCKLTAPEALLEHWPQVRDGLQALDIVHCADGHIRFVHQGYLEFILASIWRDRLRDEDKTVIDWLNENDEQSLLRRGQLRQLLELVRDDEPAVFLEAVATILQSGTVRFHLQHLTLQFLGSLTQPNPEEGNLVVRFLQDASWRDSVIALVIVSRSQWFHVIDASGLWNDWLHGSESWQPNSALWVLRTMPETESDRVLELMAPFASQPDPWRTRVWHVLPRDPENDSDRAFAFRLQLVTSGIDQRLDILFSKEFARCHPRRVIELLAAIIRSTHNVPDNEHETMRNAWPYWLSRHAAEPVLLAAELEPAYTWNTLLPLVLQAVEKHPVPEHTWDEGEFQPDAMYCYRMYRFEDDGAEALPMALARAGGFWLRVAFADACTALRILFHHASRAVQQVVGSAWISATDQAADEAIRWLTSNTRRFDLAEIGKSRQGALAKKLISLFGSHCTQEVYNTLESAILQYYPEQEKRCYTFRIQTYRRRERWYGPNEYGRAQYGLLSALPSERRSSRAVTSLGQFLQKYGRSPEEMDEEREPKAGHVSSPIAAHRARLSDSAWLKLVVSGTNADGRRSFRGHFVESSPEMFARDLEVQAARDPRRFANLALRVPRDILPIYWSSLLHGLRLTNPPDATVTTWQPVTVEQCTAVLRKVGFDLNREVGVEFCNCVAQRPECAGDSVILEIICQYATNHPDPAHDGCVLTTEADERLEIESINTVRALAARAIEVIQYGTREATAHVLPTLRSLAADQVACVRTAAIGAIIPVLNWDRTVAVDLFLNAVCDASEEVLRTASVRRFLGYVIKSHIILIQPVVERMAMSQSVSVAKEGAAWIAVIRLFMITNLETFEKCASGSPAQRRGVAETLAQHLDCDEVAPTCRQLLPQFFDDDDSEVRKAAAQVLHNDVDWAKDGNANVLERYFRSKAFLDEVTFSLWTLDEFKGNLPRLASAIFAASDTCSTIAMGASNSGPDLDSAFETLSKLLLRLYGQTDVTARDLRKKCLDRFDAILRNARWLSLDVIRNLDE